MKKIILTFAFLITMLLQNFAQCCPYLDNAELSPTTATSLDSIYLITQVTTPALGNFIGYTITKTDTLTTVDACYYSGVLAALQTYNDTFNLGVNDTGMLNVKFVAWISGNDTTCTFSQNQTIDLQMEIEGSNSIEQIAPTLSSVNIFPNPIQDGQLSLSAKNDFDKIKIYNQLGRLILEKNNIQKNQMTLDLKHLSSGVYFINGELNDGQIFSQKFIK